MSVEAMAAVLHHSRAKGTAKLVLLGIANHEGDGGAWPSIATLATYANVTERNVQKAIDMLTSKGELEVEVQQGGDRDCPDERRPNLYRVKVSCPGWCDRSTQHRDTRKLTGTQVRAPWALLTGVSHATPHRRRGVSLATPGGVSLATPKPPTSTTTHEVVPKPQDTRACDECSQPELRCQLAQSKLPAPERHEYRPVVRP